MDHNNCINHKGSLSANASLINISVEMIPFRLNAMREVRDDLVEETVNDLCAYTVNGTRVDTADGLFFCQLIFKRFFFS